ncbi:hypothetical protein [Delftia acidovorans]|uniref:hypothetical protein n=1 Tax=Delftia acidovorans TaxID=80866 RepID=UPI0012FE4BCD|nr:hypothetical protein [Delftia acidovorans]
MILNIEFKENFFIESIIKNKFIPCVCRVKGLSFTVEFSRPLKMMAAGYIPNFNLQDICDRYSAAAGGEYAHYCFGEIGLNYLSDSSFEVIDLKFFDEIYGWINIIENSVLAEKFKKRIDIILIGLESWIKIGNDYCINILDRSKY